MQINSSSLSNDEHNTVSHFYPDDSDVSAIDVTNDITSENNDNVANCDDGNYYKNSDNNDGDHDDSIEADNDDDDDDNDDDDNNDDNVNSNSLKDAESKKLLRQCECGNCRPNERGFKPLTTEMQELVLGQVCPGLGPGKFVYPVSQCHNIIRTDTEIREDITRAFDSNKIIHGVKNISPLVALPEFDIPKSDVIEVIHAVFLGIVRQHTKLLLTKTNTCHYVGSP
ncbi:hypothetical protein KQX54_014998 [Cotesia glomerata]|uniref:Uncharacterized protein n=1 Tax=Cotesia glomerata TaxID=32391 RepID=A0AAV7J4M4_COTGL|nr:hypothetical protein KQX54_014998 [Cotesia glomerata]